jgi:Family of unknown function (DUF5681)
MSEKVEKATSKPGAVKQRENSAKKVRGKPFSKGNPHAFKPGQSGNPQGRPRARVLSEYYREWLARPLPGDPARTFGDAIAEAVCRQAVEGDVAAAREIADRVEGKPRQAIDLSSEEQRRAMVERAVNELMTEANLSREQAIKELIEMVPESARWIN